MALFFVYDGYSDVAHEDDVRVMTDISMDTFAQPTHPSPQRRMDRRRSYTTVRTSRYGKDIH